MTTSLYNELLALLPLARNQDGARAAIMTAKQPTLPEQFRRDMMRKTWLMWLPEMPEEQEFMRGTFWDVLSDAMPVRRLWLGSDERKQRLADWLKERRERAMKKGEAYPPKPIFRPQVVLPQPKDGKE